MAPADMGRHMYTYKIRLIDGTTIDVRADSLKREGDGVVVFFRKDTDGSEATLAPGQWVAIQRERE